MPIINGCKYSCEPCIRGHRATSCQHTDRILVEVRKPGRPLQSCGHSFETCTCGRLSEYFRIGDVLPEPKSEQPRQSSKSPVDATIEPHSVSPLGRPKSKSQARGQAKVAKRSRKKVASPTSAEAASHEPVTEPQEPKGTRQTSWRDTIGRPPSDEVASIVPVSNFLSPSTSAAPTPVMSSTSSVPGSVQFIHYQDTYLGRTRETQSSPILPVQTTSPAKYSSRIEDVYMGPSSTSQQAHQPSSQTVVHSQYIIATQDSAWRSTNNKEPETVRRTDG